MLIASTSAKVVEQDPKTGCHQHLSLLLRGFSRSESGCDPSAFQITASVLELKSVSFYVCLLIVESLFPIAHQLS